MQVDMTALKQMGENDLKEIGIPMVTVYYSFLILFYNLWHMFCFSIK